MRPSANDRPMLDGLIDLDDANFNLEETVERFATVRADAASSRWLDLGLIRRLHSQHQGLLAAKEQLRGLEGVIEKFKAPPFFPALFISLLDSPHGPRALIRQGGTERIVGFGDDVDGTALRLGDSIYLARELNVIMGRAPGEMPEW